MDATDRINMSMRELDRVLGTKFGNIWELNQGNLCAAAARRTKTPPH